MILKKVIESKVIEALNNIGILVDIEDFNSINLKDYEMDSIMFVSFIVELEESFNIMIPDEYLSINQLTNLNFIVSIVEEQLSS